MAAEGAGQLLHLLEDDNAVHVSDFLADLVIDGDAAERAARRGDLHLVPALPTQALAKYIQQGV